MKKLEIIDMQNVNGGVAPLVALGMVVEGLYAGFALTSIGMAIYYGVA